VEKMNKVVIGIIGVNGKYGQWLKIWFENHDQEVIGSDLGTKMTVQNVVERASVVIFAVPIDVSEKVMIEAGKYSTAKQLFMDITGLKTNQVQAMLKSNAEVAGLHPMCAPTVETWKGQVLVTCPKRLDVWRGWFQDFLDQTQANVKELSPEQHDRLMSIVQCMVHAVSLNMASTLRALNVDISDTLEVASPFYRIALSLMGRILGQDARNYALMQMCNPNSLDVLSEMEKQFHLFRLMVEKMIKNNDTEPFESVFADDMNHLGQEDVKQGFDMFQQLISLMVDLSKRDSITIEVKESFVELFASMATTFAKNGVNITSFHSFKTSDGFKLVIGLDKEVKSSEVQLALKESLIKLPVGNGLYS
jgi:prephenate dehydrogenase